MDRDGFERYHEEQRFRQWWIWLLVGFLVVLQWAGFVEQIVLGRPFGDNPAPDWMMILLWLVFGIGFPIFFLTLKLTVTVTGEAIQIHYRPLARRTIPISEVAQAEAGTYSPLGEYGGWGIRGFGRNRAYNVSGRRGVALNLTDGRKVMIGSQRAEELARAIEAVQNG